jgi:hypothetical protein
MIDFDTENCKPVTTEINVIESITPVFVVQKVNKFTGTYFGPR